MKREEGGKGLGERTYMDWWASGELKRKHLMICILVSRKLASSAHSPPLERVASCLMLQATVEERERD
jgi:hypothetical protein